jgi:hypothetical protein
MKSEGGELLQAASQIPDSDNKNAHLSSGLSKI